MKKVMSYIITIMVCLSFLACAEKVQADVPPTGDDDTESVPLGPSDPTIPEDPVQDVTYEIGSVVEGGILYKVEGITGFVLYPYAMEPSVWTIQRSGELIKEEYRISSSDNDGQANVARMKEKSSDLSAYPPAKYCDDLEGDWYLPSNAESKALFAVFCGGADYDDIPSVDAPVEYEQKYKDARATFDGYILAGFPDGDVLNSAPETEAGERAWTSTTATSGKPRSFGWGKKISYAIGAQNKYTARCIKQVNLSDKKEEGPVQYAGKEGEYDVYLLLGQSNMAGRGEMLEEDYAVIPDVYLLDSEGKPVPAAGPMNIYSSIRKTDKMQAMGPGASFAKTITEQTGRKVLLVVNARGGSSINDWRKDLVSYIKVGNSSKYTSVSYYGEALRRAQQAMQYGALKGIIWHQGCSDQSDDRYVSRLTYVVEDFRKDLGADVPFIAGQLGGWRSSSAGFNERITRINKYLIWSDWVSSKDCQPIVTASSDGQPDEDDPHFNRASQILMGKRYAQKILDIVYGVEYNPEK